MFRVAVPSCFSRSARFLRHSLLAAFLLVAVSASATESPKGMVSYQKESSGVITVTVDGSFFAQFRPDADVSPEKGAINDEYGTHTFVGTPVVWPICSAAGTLMSRGFPMDARDITDTANGEFQNILENSRLDDATARKDHIHHRSLWFNHGDVNGYDFWGPEKGRIVQQKVASITTEAHSVTVKTENAWIPEENAAAICADQRTITFGVLPNRPEMRYIDYDITVTAVADKVLFADTKEGSFGYRTPGSMDVTAVERQASWGGHILNSSQETDEDTWGKRASWVDYYGPVPKRLSDSELKNIDSEKPETIPLTTAGVDIMNHPSGFRYPSWYHVRTYGLFAVNPFGIMNFEPNARLDGSVTLEKGDSLSFRYRVLIHDASLTFEELQNLFNEYKAVTKD